MIRRIPPEQVRFGMYVTGLGGPWLSHPFWRARFKLVSERDVSRLKASDLDYVEIDDELGVAPVPDRGATHRDEEGPACAISKPKASSLALAKPKREAGSVPVLDAGRARAIRTMARARTVARKIFDAGRLGKDIPVDEAFALVAEMDTLFDRGEHALLDMIRMKSIDEYTYLHSVAVSALMLKFARELELPAAEVRECGLAGLLHDVGKMRIPNEVLHKPGALAAEEFAIVKTHPEIGSTILCDIPDLPRAVIAVAQLHHEKIDGSGYPLGLKGDEIPLFARMGAICDVYDALTSDRVYKEAWTPAQAFQEMAASAHHLDAELLLIFARSIGMEDLLVAQPDPAEN